MIGWEMNQEDHFTDLPVIETRRLVLRPLKMSDAEDVFEYASDPEVSKYTFWETHHSIADTQAFLSRVIREESAHWGIGLKENNKVIGTCYLHSFDLKHRRIEIGYGISRKCWGQGYMTEAVREVILSSFEQWDLNRIGAVCIVEHTASARVLEKVGMTFEGIVRQYAYTLSRFWDLKVYSILRDEICWGEIKRRR